MPRPATLADYDWLFANAEYGENPLEHAAEALPMILSWCPASILDIGGWRGEFAKHMRRAGLAAEFTEPSPRGVGEIVSPLPDLPGIASQKYEMVTCFDVLEHLEAPDVRSSLFRISEIAKKYVICTVYTGSDAREINGEMVEMHLSIMSKELWRDLFSACLRGFSVSFHATQSPNRWLFVSIRL